MSNNKTFDEAELNLSTQSVAFVDYLTKSGMIGDLAIQDEQKRAKHQELNRKVYHNTEELLKSYRDLVWALECFPSDIATSLNQPLNDLDQLIEGVDLEMSLENKKLESRMHAVARSRLLVDRLNEAISFLRRKPGEGEDLYQVIYYTYVHGQKENVTYLFDNLRLTKRRYYELKKKAIKLISLRLWSTPDGNLDPWVELLSIIDINPRRFD